MAYIESFKGLFLNPYGFYLVILTLGITKALMKFHIKPVRMTKTQGFMGMICFYAVEIT